MVCSALWIDGCQGTEPDLPADRETQQEKSLISVQDNGLRKLDKVINHQPVFEELSCDKVGGQSVCICHDAGNFFCRCGTAQRDMCPPSSNAVPTSGFV